ncbi:CPBP family glutamic-type intramembrane protease [Streptomyces sp. WMMC500]|uniref:CPBP family glutamic-type intramembrane protease n=1 Tax=Streptomyces sp. WMMC500 TaxID=3015154 RepID=UPI00248B86C0|nr:CPBP family glutamic-type intramembrane protease [Streptomyces sp. WMMC500]WBB61317.1 CPBP family glutamic-type intramembrane protease [Streptomyces sp. WMMC500]
MTTRTAALIHRLDLDPGVLRLLSVTFLWVALTCTSLLVPIGLTLLPGYEAWKLSTHDIAPALGLAAAFTIVAALLAGSRTSLKAAAARLTTALGLRPGTRRTAAVSLAAGLGAGALCLAVAEFLVRIPALSSTPAADDPRHTAVAGTSTTVHLLDGALSAPVHEELLFRAPLLLLLTFLATPRARDTIPTPLLRHTTLAAAAALSALVFTTGHELGGPVNLIFAAFLAAVTTALLLWRRSIVPCVVAHTVHNTAVTALWLF